MARSVSVAIVGGGFGGVAAAVALKQSGLDDLVILERGDRLGGVWRANTYPGIACDVPSHLYSFSFAPNPRWTRRYSAGAEIQLYLEDVARRFDVARHVRFGAEVECARYDDDIGCWEVELAGGERITAEVLVTACGQLQRPAIPAVPGLDRFAGSMFHSAHWDHDLDLRGRRVAVLGTGASAIQFVPAIAGQVGAMTIFQRSAPWVLPKLDTGYAERTRRLYERQPALQKLWRNGWWLALESLVPVFTRRPPRLARIAAAPFRAIAQAQRFVQLRGDRRLLAGTRPDYALGCKRMLVTSEWYPTLRRRNVELVTEPIREVVVDAVITADGRVHPADTIIFGTGFTATEFLAPMEVQGLDGRRLAEAWEHGAEAYLGLAIPSFPNMFLLYGPNTNHGTGSAITLLEAQAAYVAGAVGLIAAGTAERLEVRHEVHDAFQSELSGRLAETVWATCTSWYVNGEGRVTNNWPGSFQEYFRRIARPELADFVTSAPKRAVPAETP
jgi:cation diffusion facilitator CzcD-associated flavoprotein CzcO